MISKKVLKRIKEGIRWQKDSDKRFQRNSFPDKVMIQTTSFCNANCIMCPYAETSKIQEQGVMDEKLFKKIVHECSKHKVSNILLYLMNEPLMDKNIVEKINYAKEKNPNTTIHIVTNGSLLNKKLSEKIIESKLDYIEFSIHGIRKESYESVMKKLKFDDTIKKVKEFYELAIKAGKDEDYINIKFLEIEGLIDNKEAEEIKEFWHELGIKRINHSEKPISRAGNVKWIKKTKKEKIKGCNSIWRNELLHILFNGEVILCCMDWKREEKLGDVNKKSIKSIWNSKRYHLIEKMIRGQAPSEENFICKRCEESI